MTSIQIDRTDGLSSAAAIKGPCRVATTANISLYGEQTIDGVAVVAGDRVLVKNQTSGSENGVYVADTGQWRRSKDFSRTNDVVKGTQVAVTDGTVSGGFTYSLTANNPINVGVTSLSFGVAAGVQTAVNAAAAAAASAAAAAASAASIIPLAYVEKSGNYTALVGDNNAWHRYTATATVSLTAAATLGVSWRYKVSADGGDVTIDPNASELINGVTSLVVPDGYSTTIVCSGTAFYSDGLISNESIEDAFAQPFVNVASAATADIGAAASQNVTITGTTTITSFGTVAAGTFRRLVFSGILTLTHNATSLILPNGGSNIVTAAGDSLEAVSLGSGNWRVTSYEKATPSATRAWVLFTGATGAISASDNVTSVTRNGVGDYTVNFTVAMQDANYVTFCSVQGVTASNVDTINVNNTGGQTTTSVRIIAVRNGTGAFDPTKASVMVVR